MVEFIPLLAQTNATSAGHTAGKIIVIAGAAAGALKCYAISRRPTTNAKCVLSLMFLLLAWSFCRLLASLRDTLPVSPPWQFGTGLLAFSLVITAMVLGILGLVEFAQKRDVYIQGRAQAIWSLIFCAFFLSAFALGLLKGTGGWMLSRNQPLAEQPLSPVLQPVAHAPDGPHEPTHPRP